MITAFFGLLAGAFTWTLLEYLLHRFVFHAFVFGKPSGAEHAKHHAQVDWFAPWSSKLVLALPVVTPLGAMTSLVTGPWLSLSFVAGLLGAWLGYELLHRRIHVAAPIGAHGRWARRHHLSHHFDDPRMNHGVTSPLWDWVFGTWAAAGEVRVPRRHAQKLPWLLDAHGEIAVHYAGVYRLR